MSALFVVVLALLLLLFACGPQGTMAQQLRLGCNAKLDKVGAEQVKWSQWPSGVQVKGGYAYIACGKAVVLKATKFKQLKFANGLHVEGWLKIVDNVDRVIHAPFVVVEGRLLAGSPEAPFRTQLDFVLTRRAAPLQMSKLKSHKSRGGRGGSSSSGDLGHQAFVVEHGSVELYGLAASCPTWTRLTATAWKGDRSVTVEATGELGACWQRGDAVALASTDFDYDDTEERVVTSVQVVSSTEAVVHFAEPLAHHHWGSAFATGSARTPFVEERGEVALVSRKITISGETHPSSPNMGGHFRVNHTPEPQVLHGVEFFHMGRQGLLGMYPIHWHMASDTRYKALISHNSIHDTFQRCVVIHGSHRVHVMHNIALRTKGHCFMLEDGVEMGVQFYRNLGMVQMPVEKLIPAVVTNTDNRPSTFWVSNPNNSYVDNVAAGAHSGFWFELQAIRGPSAALPEAQGVVPRNVPLLRFEGNSAHSNRDHGFRSYPHGYRPKGDPAVIKRFFSWKNNGAGVFLHNSDNVHFRDAVLADNSLGVDFNVVQDCALLQGIVVGETDNVGNPSGCLSTWGGPDCRPTDSCAAQSTYIERVPKGELADWPVGRSIPGGGYRRARPILGARFSQDRAFQFRGGNAVRDVEFLAFRPLPCRAAAAVGVHFDREEGKFNAAHLLANAKLLDGDLSQLIYLDVDLTFPGAAEAEFEGGNADHGSAVFLTAIRLDADELHFAVADNDDIVDSAKCQRRADWNAHECNGVCYRTVAFALGVLDSDTVEGVEGLQLHLQWTDSAGVDKTVSLRPRLDVDDGALSSWGIEFAVSVPYVAAAAAAAAAAADGMVVTLSAPDGLDLAGRGLRVTNGDGGGCAADDEPLVLRFPRLDAYAVRAADGTLLKGCAPSVLPFTPVHLHHSECESDNDVLVIELSPRPDDKEEAVATLALAAPVSALGTCEVTEWCSAFFKQSVWKYLNDGSSLHPDVLMPIGFQHALLDDSSWESGRGELGFGDGDETTDIDHENRGITSYFRKRVNLADTSCFERATVGLRFDEALIIFLNGVEVLRLNLPEGDDVHVRANTRPTKSSSNDWRWASYELDAEHLSSLLVEGDNFLAVELHQWSASANEDASFDMTLALEKARGCDGGANVKEEVCDGLDNNGDGSADEALVRQCWTPCGVGAEVCAGGAWGGCDAPLPSPEVCDGVDNNCDGVVDNAHDSLWELLHLDVPIAGDAALGIGLDCPVDGDTCFMGKCVPVVQHNISDPAVAVDREALWRYSMNAVPDWPHPSPTTLAGLASGHGELGYGDYSESTTIGLAEKPTTIYFAKEVRLDRLGLAMEVRLLCDAGCIVYWNGVEVHRKNLPDGAVSQSTLATASGSEWRYEAFQVDLSELPVPVEPVGGPGLNVLAVEAHTNANKDLSFDAEIDFFVANTCAAAAVTVGEPLALTQERCVVNATETLVAPKSTSWAFADGGPQDSAWAELDFDADVDAGWTHGAQAPIGYAHSDLGTDTGKGGTRENSPAAMYFRKEVHVADSHCIVALRPRFQVEDGLAVYINGHELFRRGLPFGGPLGYESFATGWMHYRTWHETQQYNGADFFVHGTNVVAVEVHRNFHRKNMGFDLELTATMDVNCLLADKTPAPAGSPPTRHPSQRVAETPFPTPSLA